MAKDGGIKMEKNNREIRIGKNRMNLGDDNILYHTVVGDVDEKIAIEIKEAGITLANMVEGKVDTLIDLNNAGKASYNARKIAVESYTHEKFRKIAMFGLHSVARVLASFVIGVSKKKDLRFFKTKEEALAWLKE